MKETVKTLEGTIEMDYKWAPGSTVGRFLTHLRDLNEVIAVRCPKTSRVYLPPQSWSPYGQIKMDRFQVLNGKIRLKAGSIVYKAPWNIPEGVNVPYMYAAIQFSGADTELLHIVCEKEEILKNLKPGDELEIVWKKEKTGTIRDIEYFTPVSKEKL
ncbi:MAG: hypothetical protein L6Q54_09785 [Leptospiraceae bacterium]|nr:hypothetical protein [Leptospiraceae bacterium]MCK6381516.1 hypothetical protein [Leptospiraceae bacterium]NUM42615.1 hypothetical protein [Leptospiraceae bacterium]